MLRRLRLLVVAVGLICVLVTVSASARSERAGTCNAHRKHALRFTHKVVVFGQATGTDEGGGPLSTYYACARPGGARIAIGRNSVGEGEYPPNATVDSFQIKGTLVAAEDSSGAAEAAACSKFQTTGCPPVKDWIEVVDAKTRRHLKITVLSLYPFAVSATGALAWIDTSNPSSDGLVLDAIVLRRGSPHRLAGSIRTVATGTIDQHSLHLHNLTLSWTQSGQPHQVTLA